MNALHADAGGRGRTALRWGGVLLLLALPLYVNHFAAFFGRTFSIGFLESGERYLFRVINQAGIYILLAIGLNIVVGYAGLLDLGFIAFYAVGAYTYALLGSAQLGLHFPFWVVLIIAPLISATFGVILGFPVLRLRGDYLAIVTLGFGEVIRLLLNNMSFLTNGPRGISAVDIPSFDRSTLSHVAVENAKLILYPPLPSSLAQLTTISTPVEFYYLILVLCALAVIASHRLQTSKIGRAWVAVREDEDAAQAMGINRVVSKLLAFSCGAAMSGFAGVVFAGNQGFVSPDSFVLQESITVLAMVVLGGLASIPGVVLGAIALSFLPEMLREYASYRIAIFGLLLSVVMVVRPQGLWPVRLRLSMPYKSGTRETRCPGRKSRNVVASERVPDNAVVLHLQNVSKSFGGLVAINGLSFSARQGDLVAVIGPNGAGKTTLFDVVTGVHPPTSGNVTFLGRDLAGLRPYEITLLGIARTFQNIKLFRKMSVLDNIVVGTHRHNAARFFGVLFRTKCARDAEHASVDKAERLLDFVGLTSRRNDLAGDLSYGDQRRLEIGRALATRPRLLLLDEPVAGMNATETNGLTSLIREIQKIGITVMLIEHDMKFVMGISDHIVVLDHGVKIAEGTPDRVCKDEKVISAYLGP